LPAFGFNGKCQIWCNGISPAGSAIGHIDDVRRKLISGIVAKCINSIHIKNARTNRGINQHEKTANIIWRMVIGN
jgi:hypothetical protein